MFMMAGIAGWAFGGFAGVETGWRGTDTCANKNLQECGIIYKHLNFYIF